MTSSTILWIYLGLAGLDLAWGLFLTVLNYRNVAAQAGRVPEEFRGSVTEEEGAKSSSYSRAGMRLGFVEEPVITAITLAAVALGFFGFLDRATAGLFPSPYLHGAIFLGIVLALSGLISLPFSLYSTFVLEKRYGFNTTTFKTWLADGLKGIAITLVIGLPLLALLYAFIDGAGRLWWLWAAAIFSLIDLGLSVVYPLFIAPLFNKFTPLSEGSLADRIRGLAERLGFKMSGIYVMDGSKRSRHSNAYFTGFGRARRVVLYDTLVSSMSEDEILAVLAHEIGHAKKRHILKGTALSIVLSFVGFYLLSLLMAWPELYAAFGFVSGGSPVVSKHAILLIFALVSGPATFFLTPAFSAFSRRHEYEADRFSAEAVGGEYLASSLIKLNRENASNLSPHPLYSFWYYSHPTLSERLGAINGDAQGQSPR